MRLDRFLSNNCGITRSQVRRQVKAKRVLVNNSVVTDPGYKFNELVDVATLDGLTIAAVGKMYYMLNKPSDYICANSDAQHPTVLDLIAKSENFIGAQQNFLRAPIKDLQIAGRLDINTTGLVLVTNDGEWNHRVTAPSSACSKTYCVELDSAFDCKTLEHFSNGIQLDGERKKTLPATLKVLNSHSVKLSIQEGKYHQVKRMFAATGNRVTKLHRESIGDIQLDSSLQAGQYRELNYAEIIAFVPHTAIDKTSPHTGGSP
ncbi:MAG: 16S rRNA pseudouridine516 synthase [Lentisphaeria bacterium]|jgi:16S rRNA pseudouridine516 synthase